MNSQNRYAPQTLDEVVFESQVSKSRIYAYASGQLSGHIILYGPNGTGKTTVANLLIKEIGGEYAQYDEFDANQLLAKDNLVDFLKQSSHNATLTISGKYFLVLNEFDNAQAKPYRLWNALDAIGDKIMMIITTNNPLAIHSSFHSRCCAIQLAGVTPNTALPRVQHILQSEGIALADPVVLNYLQNEAKKGDMRRYLRQVDELLYFHKNNIPLPQITSTKPVLKAV